MFKKLASNIAFILLFTAAGLAQQVQVKGQFHKDSVKIGEPVPYSLTAKYPKELNVVFPDSLFNFAPFEYERKDYFTTRSDSTESLDSAIYYLSTFEIDSIQYLSLPVYQVVKGDTVIHRTKHDSVFLVELIEQLPDSVVLKENTSYLNVPTEFNYPYFLIGTGILVFIALVVLVVFGGKIRKAWLIRRMNKQFKKFEAQFDEAGNSLYTQNNPEQLISIWKKYLEKLEKLPYTKLTTKEIKTIFKGETSMTDVLRAFDKWMYSGHKVEQIQYTALKTFARQRMEAKREEVKHG